MGFLFCLKGLISGFALLFVFLKPKPDNKKTPDLDRSGETVTVTFSLKIQPFVEGFLFSARNPHLTDSEEGIGQIDRTVDSFNIC